MHGLLKGPHRRGQRHYQRRGRRFRNGERAAALRADTAAKILLGLPVSAGSSADAAAMCGSNPAYVKAAITLLQAKDAGLVRRVKWGLVPLLTAAASVKNRVALVKAYRAASPDDLESLAHTVGPAAVWDAVIAPALS
jgi:hypothetical protein